MLTNNISEPLEDVAFLARSEHRVTVLEELAAGPRSRAALRATTGASASTISRTLRAFEERNWISRTGAQYELTPVGAFVAEGLQAFLECLETERRFRSVCQLLPTETDWFGLAMAPDAVVTVADVDAPYRPVNRFASLLRTTARFRFVGTDVALLEPCVTALQQQLADGMDAVVVGPPAVAELLRATDGTQWSAVLESSALTVWVHDELPSYGICLFDDRTAISCDDRDSGQVRALIETAAPDAREWAVATFEAARDDARPVTLESAVG